MSTHPQSFDDIDLTDIESFEIEVIETSIDSKAVETAASCSKWYMCSCSCSMCRACSCSESDEIGDG